MPMNLGIPKRHVIYRGLEKNNLMFFGYDYEMSHDFAGKTLGNNRRAKRTVISSNCRSKASVSGRRRRRLADHIASCRRRDDTNNNYRCCCCCSLRGGTDVPKTSA